MQTFLMPKSGFRLTDGMWFKNSFREDKRTAVAPDWWKRDRIQHGSVIAADDGHEEFVFKGQLSKVVKSLAVSMSDQELFELCQEYGIPLPLRECVVELGGVYVKTRAIPTGKLRDFIKSYLRAEWLFSLAKNPESNLNPYVNLFEGKLILKLPGDLSDVVEENLMSPFQVENEKDLPFLPWNALVYLVNRGMEQNTASQFLVYDPEKRAPVVGTAPHSALIPALWGDLFRRITKVKAIACEDCGCQIYAERRSKKRCSACRQAAYDRKVRKRGNAR